MENRIGETASGTANHDAASGADVSAVVEQPELAAAHDLKHNHKPNFGRYVAGCAKCERVKTEKPTKAAKARSPRSIDQGDGVYITHEQLQALMAGKSDSGLTDSLKEFARELRRPDPEEELKRQDEKARKERVRAARLEEVRIQEENKAKAQSLCPHVNEKGRSLIYRGQVFSDGKYHPMCHRCQKEFEPVTVTMAEMAGMT